MEQKNDFLGRDPIGRLLWRMSLPAIVAQLINLLYNLVDRVYIGHMPEDGALALTGVGVCLPIIMIVSAFAALVSNGGAPRASMAMGKGDYDEAEKILGNSVALQIVISAVLTVLLLLFYRPLLLTFGASENTIGFASDYMKIYAAGTVFVQLTLGMNAFITAQGFARTGMLSVMIGAGCNIVLDPVLIYGFGMGVRGAATDGNSLILQTHFYGWKQIRNVRPDRRRAQPVAEIDLYLRMMDTVFHNFLSGIRQKLPAPVRAEEHFVFIGASCPHLKNAKLLYHFLRHFIEHRVVCRRMCRQKPELRLGRVACAAPSDPDPRGRRMLHLPEFLFIVRVLHLHIFHNVCLCNIAEAGGLFFTHKSRSSYLKNMDGSPAFGPRCPFSQMPRFSSHALNSGIGSFFSSCRMLATS